MKENRNLGTATVSVVVFCCLEPQKIAGWKSHLKRNVFGNSKAEPQFLPSHFTHIHRPYIIPSTTAAQLSTQDTKAKKPRHLIWALLLDGKRVYLTPERANAECVCVSVWEFCLPDKSLAGREMQRKEKLTSTGQSSASVSVNTPAAVWHLPPQGPLGARRRGRFTAGCLQWNEPGEASQKDSQRHFHNNK